MHDACETQAAVGYGRERAHSLGGQTIRREVEVARPTAPAVMDVYHTAQEATSDAIGLEGRIRELDARLNGTKPEPGLKAVDGPPPANGQLAMLHDQVRYLHQVIGRCHQAMQELERA